MDVFTRDELPRLIAGASLPGIDPTEVRVVREFLRRHGAEYHEYRFNVRVGAGVQLAGDFTEKFKADWERRTKSRLDLVCWTAPAQVTLIEAKVQWTNAAVWQLLDYRDHYVAENPGGFVELLGVCEAYTPQAAALARDRQIRIVQYGFPGDLPAAPASSELQP